MAVHTFDDLLAHAGHDVRVSRYVGFEEDGTQVDMNVAIECETCYTVLLDFDRQEPEKKVCFTCGSDEVFYDAYVAVNDPADVIKFDTIICETCGIETTLKTEE